MSKKNLEISEHSIRIYQSKRGNIKYMFGSLLMSLTCLMGIFVNFEEEDSSKIFKFNGKMTVENVLLKLILIFGIVFFLYAAFYFVMRMKKNLPVLTVDEKGITDLSSAIAFGTIKWDEIEEIYVDSCLNNRFIELRLHHPEYYVNQLSGLKKKAVQANLKMGHQPVCITLNATDIKIDEVYPKMLELFNYYSEINTK